MKLNVLALGVLSLALGACGGEKAAEPTTAPAEAAKTEQATKIRFITESNFKPFSYLDNQGNLVGFEIDLVNALCAQMKAECEINSQDWDSLIPSLNANKADAAIAGMSVTEERLQVVDFSEPYFNNTLVLVAKKGDNVTISDVDGKNVATQQATLSAQYLEKNHPKAIIKNYDKQDNAYLDLSAGRVEFMLSDIVPMMDWLKTDSGANFEVKGDAIDVQDVYGIAVRKGDPLKAKIDAALTELKANGEYDKLVAAHFDAKLLK